MSSTRCTIRPDVWGPFSLLFSPNRSGGSGGKVPLSSVPGLHCSGEGVNLPIGDSLLGRGGGSGEEIVATLISTLVSASHCSPWGSEVMEGLSLGLPVEEGAVTNSPSGGPSRLTAKCLVLQSLEVTGLQMSPSPLGSGFAPSPSLQLCWWMGQAGKRVCLSLSPPHL